MSLISAMMDARQGGKRQHTLRRMSQLAAEDPQAPLKGSSLHGSPADRCSHERAKQVLQSI